MGALVALGVVQRDLWDGEGQSLKALQQPDPFTWGTILWRGANRMEALL